MWTALQAVLSYWRWGLAGLTVLALLWAGFVVNNWRRDALEKQATALLLEAERDATRKAKEAHDRAEKENRTLIIRLQQKAANDRAQIQTIIREVPRYVARNDACVFSPDAVRLRNRATGM